MFEFLWPSMAYLLGLPLLVRLLWPKLLQRQQEQPAEGERTTLLYPDLTRLEQSFKSQRPRAAIAGKLQALTLALLWIALTLAVMRPQWLEPHTELRSEGYDLMLAIDTSRSMTALDFSSEGKPVSRMAVVKGVMGRFIANRQGDRVGLVIFGNQAFVQSPLTLDINAASRILQTVEPGIAGNATAMGDAIGLSVKKLRQRPQGSRVMLLVTDGENTAGLIPPADAAALAAREGIRIYAIGVGSNQKEVMILGSDGNYRSESDIGLDETSLQQIATTTGGAYFRATNSLALEEISQQIDTLEKTETESRTVFVPRPLYQWPLGFALFLLLLLGLFPEGRMRLPGSQTGE